MMIALQQVTSGCDPAPAGVVNAALLRSSLPVGPNPAEPAQSERPIESAAARKAARHGDVALRDRIVLENLSLVKSIAARVHSGLPIQVDLEDLTHAGIMGLIGAASRFDAGKDVVFATLCQAPHSGCNPRQPATTRLGVAGPASEPETT